MVALIPGEQAILASDPSDPNRLDADNDGEACERNASSSPQPAPSPAPQPKEKEKSESSTESSKESSKVSSKESYTKESTAEKQEQRKELPATDGSSLLLPAGALLLGTGLIVSIVLRRR